MRKLSFALVLLLAAVLAGCASGPPKRVYPPQARVQEISVQADGQWLAIIRVQNFSTVPMRFSRLEATLTVGGAEATRLDLDPGISVGPGSIELVRHVFAPGAAAKTAVDVAFSNKRAVRYQITGRLVSAELKTDDDFDYQSALNPVPGLAGVLR